jgi:hypothetical protein
VIAIACLTCTEKESGRTEGRRKLPWLATMDGQWTGRASAAAPFLAPPAQLGQRLCEPSDSWLGSIYSTPSEGRPAANLSLSASTWLDQGEPLVVLVCAMDGGRGLSAQVARGRAAGEEEHPGRLGPVDRPLACERRPASASQPSPNSACPESSKSLGWNPSPTTRRVRRTKALLRVARRADSRPHIGSACCRMIRLSVRQALITGCVAVGGLFELQGMAC